jgi:hypothetical protein
MKSNLHHLNLKLKGFVDSHYMSFGVKFTSLSRKPDVGNISTRGTDWATSNGCGLVKKLVFYTHQMVMKQLL